MISQKITQVRQEWQNLKFRLIDSWEIKKETVASLISDRDDWKNNFQKARDELDKGWDGFVNSQHPLVRCNNCKSHSVELYIPESNNWVWGCQELPNGYSAFKRRIRGIYTYYQRR